MIDCIVVFSTYRLISFNVTTELVSLWNKGRKHSNMSLEITLNKILRKKEWLFVGDFQATDKGMILWNNSTRKGRSVSIPPFSVSITFYHCIKKRCNGKPDCADRGDEQVMFKIRICAALWLKCLRMTSPTWSSKYISPYFWFLLLCKFTIEIGFRW